MLNTSKLWSLGDMLRFYAHEFVDLTNQICTLQVFILSSKENPDPNHIKTVLNRCKPLVDKIGLRQSSNEVDHILHLCELPPALFKPEYVHALETLMRLIQNELKDSYFLHLDVSEKILYAPDQPPFGEEVERQFPCLVDDINEASKCLALGRSTAGAFHSIRCLEAGFAAIWRYLGVADPITGFERNWKNRLDNVKNAVEAKWPAKSGRMSDEAKFFDAIVGSFMGMQNPYRNNTMHFDAKYTPEEARHIFELVKGIMKRIAARMDENGKPLV